MGSEMCIRDRYEVAALPEDYRLKMWKLKSLVSKHDLELMDETGREVVRILVNEIEEPKASPEARSVLARLIAVIGKERRRRKVRLS